MNTEPTTPNDLVSAALVECQGRLKAANMDATNPFFKSRYASLGAVIESSREALFSAGLAIQQTPSIVGDMVSVHTVIRHKSGQWLDGGCMSLTIGENERNSDAQLAGAILTYLRRYAWASVLGIYADEDSDGNDAPKGVVKRPTTITPPPINKNPVQSQPEASLSNFARERVHLVAHNVFQDPSQPEAHKATPEPSGVVVGPKYRLQTLNRLQAAPGGKQRPLVHQFLTVRGWIRPDQEPEDWSLDHLPKSAEEFVALGEDIKRFEREMLEGRATT